MGRALVAITAIGIFSSLCAGLIGPVYPIFVLQRLSGSISDVGLLYALFYISSALPKILAGKLVDRYGKEKIFIFGTILGTLCTLGYTLCFEAFQLYLLEILNGLAYALQRPAFLALLAEATEAKNRGFEMGIFDSAYDLAGAMASVVSALLVASFGFDLIFYLCSGFQVASGFVIIASKGKGELG
ncbi:MFS transporter [Candidatus Bathyarchaeota archaeon]|nr:MFS transporter [Candidatus Bathyarchaeota archaeon]MBS7627510.1 MFS transporter [Candidatus Bathyarchaeota archaeon]